MIIIKKLLRSKLLIWTTLFVIIAAQLTHIAYVFAFEKEGFHSDEIYSYGLSNSYDNSFLVAESVNSTDYYNVNEWIPGSILRDYIVANEGECFDYANVWKNQSTDRHPPLYYAILHTICSFFPGQFSPWFGFSINVAVFIVLQVFLFLLARKLLKSNWLALTVCLCYGFSTGALNTFIYIRMYAMITMWTVVLAYLHTRLLDINDKIKISTLIPITVIVMLGALTQHEFTIIAFVFAVCFCIHYLAKKEFSNFIKYGCCMLLGVMLAWAIFPPLMRQIFTEGENVIGDRLFHQIYLSFVYIITGLFGIYPNTGTLIYLSIVAPAFLAVAVVFAIPILFLIRKNSKFVAWRSSVKQWFKRLGSRIKSFRPVRFFKKVLMRIKNIRCIYVAMLLASFAIIFLAASSNDFFMMNYCDRYVFVTYPMFMMIFFAAVVYLISKIPPRNAINVKKAISSGLFALLLLNNITKTNPRYLFEGVNKIGDLSVMMSDSECIVVETNYLRQWRLICFSDKLMNAEHVYETNYADLNENHESLDSLKTDKPVYVFLSTERSPYDDEKGMYKLFLENDDTHEELYEDAVLEKYFSNLNYYKSAERIGMVKIYAIDYVVYSIS